MNLTVYLPPKELRPRGNLHWRKKAPITKKYRADVALIAWRRMRRESDVFPLPEATVFCRFFWGDAIKRDRDGSMSSLKAVFDGLQDAGVVENDRDLHHLFEGQEVDRENPRVELRIRKGNATALTRKLADSLEWPGKDGGE